MKKLVILLLASLIALPLVSRGNADAPDPRWLQKARQPGLSALRRATYQEIARLRVSPVSYETFPGYYNGLKSRDGSPPPTKTLPEMGLPVLPVLVEALSDLTPSAVIESSHKRSLSNRGKKRHRQVNELAAVIIVGIAQHEFVLGNFPHERLLSHDLEKHPDLVPQFQKQVLLWYARNRKRSLQERKIADVSDAWFRNRLDAVEWLGARKIHAAEPALVHYINRTLAEEKNSLRDAEVAESALALGQIGASRSLPTVKRVCRYLSDGFKQYGVTGSMDLYTLFQAHQGRALLGEKTTTLRDLDIMYKGQYDRIDPWERKEYQKRLQGARKW